MRTDVRLEGWRIAAAGAAEERFHESVFLQAMAAWARGAM